MNNQKIVVTSPTKDNVDASAEMTFPEFDIDSFIKTPNFELFLKKVYDALIKKMIREINENKNGTKPSDLYSFEAIIARNLNFTRAEVEGWYRTRDLTMVKKVPRLEEQSPTIKSHLFAAIDRKDTLEFKVANELAYEFIAPVADNEDPMADYLFTRLTQARWQDPDLVI
ncbi:MAG: hypothetical protein RL020_126 [Pseudomonadota bacterium]|jgi:hypothetical protein